MQGILLVKLCGNPVKINFVIYCEIMYIMANQTTVENSKIMQGILLVKLCGNPVKFNFVIYCEIMYIMANQTTVVLNKYTGVIYRLLHVSWGVFM